MNSILGRANARRKAWISEIRHSFLAHKLAEGGHNDGGVIAISGSLNIKLEWQDNIEMLGRDLQGFGVTTRPSPRKQTANKNIIRQPTRNI